jgi:hypothetical protein
LSRGAFQIFAFSADDPSLVCLQHETTSEFLEDDAEVHRCRGIMDRLASVCLNGGESKDFLTMLASDFQRYGYGPHGIGGSEG